MTPARNSRVLPHICGRTFELLAVAVLVAACGGGPDDGRFALPGDEAEQYETAYIAEVVPAGTAADGEHLVLRNRHEIVRADLGGWALEDADGNRLRIPFSRQIDPGEDLTVYTGSGEDTDDAIYGGLAGDVLGDEADTLVLLDAAGSEVARFSYAGG